MYAMAPKTYSTSVNNLNLGEGSQALSGTVLDHPCMNLKPTEDPMDLVKTKEEHYKCIKATIIIKH